MNIETEYLVTAIIDLDSVESVNRALESVGVDVVCSYKLQNRFGSNTQQRLEIVVNDSSLARAVYEVESLGGNGCIIVSQPQQVIRFG